MTSSRHQRIRRLIGIDVGKGLEIGPLFDPIVMRGEADIAYVDVYPGDKLREHYAHHPDVPLDKIVDPDFYLIHPEGARNLPEAVEGARFDWVVASHVVEHVPDLIGWLDEIADVLEDDGRLVLAVPDRRFCFDAIRPATSIGEMLLAHRNHDVIPSVRAVYDHYSQVVTLDLAAAWLGAPPDPNRRIHDQKYVLDQVARAEAGEYVDCHVWLFTPASFVGQIMELESLDLVSFVIEELIPPVQGELEFYVTLRRLPRGLDGLEREAFRSRGVREWVDREFSARDSAPGLAAMSDREITLLKLKRRAVSRVRRLSERAQAVRGAVSSRRRPAFVRR